MKVVCKTLKSKILEIQEKIEAVQFKMDNWDFEFAGELTFFENDILNLKRILTEYQQALEIINGIDYPSFKKWHLSQLKNLTNEQ